MSDCTVQELDAAIARMRQKPGASFKACLKYARSDEGRRCYQAEKGKPKKAPRLINEYELECLLRILRAHPDLSYTEAFKLLNPEQGVKRTQVPIPAGIPGRGLGKT